MISVGIAIIISTAVIIGIIDVRRITLIIAIDSVVINT